MSTPIGRVILQSRPAIHARSYPAFLGLLVMLLVAMAGCKVVVRTPEHGYVESLSGTYLCQPESVCEIDVTDTQFDEVFLAYSSDDSRTFSHWRRKYRGDDDDYLCGKRLEDCSLATTLFDQFEFLLGFLETDQRFFIEPVFVRSIASGGTAVTECLAPSVRSRPSDISAWNNNCNFDTILSWLDEGSCAAVCTVAVPALQQSEAVEDFSGALAWAACPGSRRPPRAPGGSAWQGEKDYVCPSEPGIDFRSTGDAKIPATTLTEIQTEIFNPSCAFSGCHGGASPAAGQNLSAGQAWSNLVNRPSSQNASFTRVIPGDAENSLLVMKVEGRAPFGSRMPLGGAALSSAQIQSIREWIDAGAQDN